MYLDITKVQKKSKKSEFFNYKIYRLKEKQNRIWLYQSLPYEPNDNFKVSGRHKVSRASCGTYKSKSYACKDHPDMTIVHSKFSCGKLGCPICYKDASVIKARKIAGRLYAFQKQMKAMGHNVYRPFHISFNPKDITKYDSYKDFYIDIKELRMILMDAGLLGGVIIHHPVRISENQDKLYTSHHFHVVGFGFLIKSNEFKEKYGFVYRNHGYRQDFDHTVGTLNYLLSHSGLWFKEVMRLKRYTKSQKESIKLLNKARESPSLLPEKAIKVVRERERCEHSRQSYFWFGLLHPRVCKILHVDKIGREALCPICKGPLYEIIDGLNPSYILNPIAEKMINKMKINNVSVEYNEIKYLPRYKKNSIRFSPKKLIPVKVNNKDLDIEYYSKFKIINESEPCYASKDDLVFSDSIKMEIHYDYKLKFLVSDDFLFYVVNMCSKKV